MKNSKTKTVRHVPNDKVYCKAKLFPPLYVTLEHSNTESDSNVFRHSKKKRSNQVKRDLTQVETMRWLQRHSMRFRTGNYDVNDDNSREDPDGEREAKPPENEFLCFTERITLAERDDTLGRWSKASHKGKDKTHGRNNSNCNAKTFFNNCSMPRVFEADLEINGNGFGNNISIEPKKKTKVNNILSLPRIKLKHNDVQKPTNQSKPVRLYVLGKERSRAMNVAAI
ncbi:unnamed protein product [Mytilus coruscus]|uniref:Uncharacterized protein n=1 Tax=Mytilus coruscus TaxID=42192 RepID=A0A6J8EDV9_MYTCO|nr:unnamed protein product [Mytilus coruscus]